MSEYRREAVVASSNEIGGSDPLLPDTTSDERPVGWGDDLDEEYDDAVDPDADRLLADRPPHHDRTD